MGDLDTVGEKAEGTAQPRRRRLSGFHFSLAAAWLAAVALAYCSFTLRREMPVVPYLTGFDENGYYAYARSLFFDGDLNFANDYTFLVRTLHPDMAGPYSQLLAENPGMPRNHFNAGPGFSALPALAAARAIAGARILFAGAETVSPFAPLYAFAFLVANITYGIGAMFLAHRVLRRWFDPWVAAFAVWGAALCGPFLYYLFVAPGMSHLTSAFFVTLAVAAWFWWREADGRAATWRGFAAGLCVGWALCVRGTSLPIALLLLEPAVACALRGEKRNWRGTLGGVWGGTLAAFVGAAAGFLPQMLVWKAVYGVWLANTQSYGFHVVPAYALHVLFSRRHGLFFWHPALLVAVVALGALCMNRATVATVRGEKNAKGGSGARGVAVALMLVFFGVVWVYGNWRVYWLGVSFGMRGFVDFLAVFAFGFAVAADRLAERMGTRARTAAWELAALFLIVNLHLALCFRGGVITVDGPLYWLDTVSKGRLYKEQLAREARAFTGWDLRSRASLFENP
jgi:hypothetical protein